MLAIEYQGNVNKLAFLVLWLWVDDSDITCTCKDGSKSVYTILYIMFATLCFKISSNLKSILFLKNLFVWLL